MTSTKRLQQELRRNSFTGVIVSERGAVVKVIPFDTPPPYEVLVECLRPHRPCGFSLYVKGEYSIESIAQRIADAVNGIRLDEAGALKPGANCL
jgi:hypothetical protein